MHPTALGKIVVAGCAALVALTAACRPPAAQAPLDVPAPAEDAAFRDLRSQSLGSFVVSSDRGIVSDPAYPDESSLHELQAELQPLRIGSWSAVAMTAEFGADWGRRCTELTSWIGPAAECDRRRWEKHARPIGVDTAQAGFFDRAHFHDEAIIPKDYVWQAPPDDPKDLWYSYYMDLTQKIPDAALVPFGVAAASGFGDGVYDVFTQHDEEGRIVAVRIVFITSMDWKERQSR